MFKENTMVKKNLIIYDEEPQDQLVIEDLETLKVLSDPLRMQIAELLLNQPRTVKQVAKELGTTPHKLYYHFNLLEDHGLIRVVDTQLVSGILEKHYRIAAKDIVVADGLLSLSKPGGKSDIEALVSGILDGTKADFMRSLHIRMEGEDQFKERFCSNATREVARLTREQAETICERLAELVREFESYDETTMQGEQQMYALTTMFYPSFSFEDSSEPGEDDES
jgi:predicted ArsR family transcriptional regulator